MREYEEGRDPIGQLFADKERFREVCSLLLRFFSDPVRRLPGFEASDLAQETLARAFRSKDSFRNDSSLRTYLLKIASRVWANRLRDNASLKRSAELTSLESDYGQLRETLPDTSAINPEAQAIRSQQQAMVDQAIRQLSPRAGLVLRLHLAGMKHKEIATALDLSLNSVGSHLASAKRQLKELIDSDADHRFQE